MRGKNHRVGGGKKRLRRKKMKTGKLVIGFVLATTLLAGCASNPAKQAKDSRDLAVKQATPIRTEPAKRPDWVDNVPDSKDKLSFIGTAGRYATVAETRTQAEKNGREQLADYCGTLVVNKARTFTATYGISSEVLAPQIAGQRLNESLAQNLAQALAPRNYYTLVYLDNTNREAFEVFVLMEVEKKIVRQLIDNFGKEQAADLAKRAAAEQDAGRRQQLQKAEEFFGGNLSSSLDL
jgi:hypothetical protein